jgi:hypothetical protein
MKTFFFILLSSSIFIAEHDIHLSVTELSKKDQNIEVIMKIFFDDLQKSMGMVPGEELPLDYAGADDLVQKFAESHFKMKLNDMQLKLELLEIEAALPAIWATFIIEDISWEEVNELEIENKIMTDLFDDQKNIVKLNFDHHTSHITFSNSKFLERIKF